MASKIGEVDNGAVWTSSAELEERVRARRQIGTLKRRSISNECLNPRLLISAMMSTIDGVHLFVSSVQSEAVPVLLAVLTLGHSKRSLIQSDDFGRLDGVLRIVLQPGWCWIALDDNVARVPAERFLVLEWARFHAILRLAIVGHATVAFIVHTEAEELLVVGKLSIVVRVVHKILLQQLRADCKCFGSSCSLSAGNKPSNELCASEGLGVRSEPRRVRLHLDSAICAQL